MDRHDAILQTTAESKYKFLVEEILADKASRWQNELYRETNKSSYDPIVGKLQNRIDTLRLTMKENRKVMDKIITDIENSNKKPDAPGYKKASAKELDEWNKMGMKLQEEFVECRHHVNAIKPGLDDLMFNQYIELAQRKTMRFLRNKYMEDGDQEYLEKGITWAANYAAKHRLKIDMKAYA
jgi:predicted house-cleaning noncanonical NTP pyrophosphatase (MazG superfamily)